MVPSPCPHPVSWPLAGGRVDLLLTTPKMQAGGALPSSACTPTLTLPLTDCPQGSRSNSGPPLQGTPAQPPALPPLQGASSSSHLSGQPHRLAGPLMSAAGEIPGPGRRRGLSPAVRPGFPSVGSGHAGSPGPLAGVRTPVWPGEALLMRRLRVCRWTGSLLAAGRQPSPSSPSSLMHAPGLARAASPPDAPRLPRPSDPRFHSWPRCPASSLSSVLPQKFLSPPCPSLPPSIHVPGKPLPLPEPFPQPHGENLALPALGTLAHLPLAMFPLPVLPPPGSPPGLFQCQQEPPQPTPRSQSEPQ